MTAAEEERWIQGLARTWDARRRILLELMQYAGEDDMSPEDRGICLRWLDRLDGLLGHPAGTWRTVLDRRVTRAANSGAPVPRPPSDSGVAWSPSTLSSRRTCLGCGLTFRARRWRGHRQVYHSRACWLAHNPMRGPQHPSTRLTVAQVQAIRVAVVETGNQAAVGRHFGVSAMTVHNIVTGARWAGIGVHE